MRVAFEKRNLSPASLMPEPLFLQYPAGLCPPAEHFLAMIPTQWGLCAAVWKHHEQAAGEASGFAVKPCNALLCRLVPPGLSVGELRRQILGRYPLCDEVLGDGHGSFHPEVVPDWFAELLRCVQGYYANSLRDSRELDFVDRWEYWQPRLDWSGLTDFAHKVLEAVAKIERGSRRTYGEIAQAVGRPRASRAVGAVLGANPWPVLIPCHRVVGAGGKMTGFSAPGGVATKRRMLAMESA